MRGVEKEKRVDAETERGTECGRERKVKRGEGVEPSTMRATISSQQRESIQITRGRFNKAPSD